MAPCLRLPPWCGSYDMSGEFVDMKDTDDRIV